MISPLSGEVLEVNQKVVDEPETVNEDPYGEGWLIRIRLTDAVGAGRAARRRGLPRARSPSSELPLADRRATARRCSRRSASRRSRSCSSRSRAGVRLRAASSTSSPRSPSWSSSRHLEELAARNAHTGVELSFLGAGIYDHYVPAVVDARALARRVPDRVHAVPAGDEPGRAAGDLRVPDRDLRADRHGRLERVRLRRHDGRRRRVLRREARDRPVEGRPRRDAEPAGAPGRQDLRAGLRPRGGRGAARRAARPTPRRSQPPRPTRRP